MTDLAIFLGFLAAGAVAGWALLIYAIIRFFAACPHADSDPVLPKHLADRPRAIRKVGFDIHDGGNL